MESVVAQALSAIIIKCAVKSLASAMRIYGAHRQVKAFPNQASFGDIINN
jgi:hypothetical protein